MQYIPWIMDTARWRHQKETFTALLALCVGKPTATGGFLLQRPVTRSFDVFFDLRLNKWMSKQPKRRWFETPSRPLWRLCNWQNGRHFAYDIFGCIFVIEEFCILIKISLKFVPKGPIDKNLAFVQIMAWRRIGAKPLFEPMLTRFIEAYMRH